MPDPTDISHLHQAFYVPSLPHFQTPASRNFSAYTILCVAVKITTIILIIFGIIFVALWLFFQPQSPEAFAATAVLSTFKLSGPGNNILTFNLTAQLNFRNPNRKYSMYYDRLHAVAFYNGYPISAVGFPVLYQRRRSTMPVDVRFKGSCTEAGDSVIQKFGKEKGEGFFNVGIKVYAAVRLKMMLIKSTQFTPEVDCLLRLPVPTNSTSLASGFSTTECNVNNFS